MAAKPVKIAIIANARQAQQELKGFSSGLNNTFRKVKRVAAIGLGVAGAALIKFGTDSVKAASDAQQSLGATEAVFGKYADTVIKRSEQAAKSIGLSANEYRELSNVTGAMLKSSGMPLKKVAGLTDDLNKRAADMAATFGGDTSEAVSAIGSLLRGEADPIEKYGVSIKQSDVNARLAAKGLDKLKGSARKQAEQQERVALLMEQTNDAAGQFGRESGTLAGQQQRLAAQFENVKAKVGTLLLPILTRLAEYANTTLIPALERMVSWLSDHRDDFAAVGREVADRLVPALKGLGDIAKAVVGFIDGLPGPIKEIGVQAGLAAVVLPRLTSGLSGAQAMLGGFIGKARNAEARAKALRTGVRNLAGVGGLVLLSEGARRADSDMGVLMTTLGGAATGFSVGGPLGAAVGGLGGLIFGLGQKVRKASKTAEVSSSSWKTYRDALDGVANSTGKAMRATALKTLQDKGVLKTAQDLGFSQGQVVDAVLGIGDARKKLTGVIKREQSAAKARLEQIIEEHGVSSRQYKDYIKQNKARLTNIEKLRVEAGEYTKGLMAKRRDLIAVNAANKAYRALPKRVRTEVEAANFKPTLRGVADLARAYNLTPKQIKTVLQTAGIPKSVKEVQNLAKRLDEVDKKRPHPIADLNTAPAMKKRNNVYSVLTHLGRDRFVPTVDANGNPAFTKSSNVRRDLLGLAGTTFSPTISANTGPAYSAIQTVHSWINGLSRTFSLSAIFGGGRKAKGGGGGAAERMVRPLQQAGVAASVLTGKAAKLANTLERLASKGIKSVNNHLRDWLDNHTKASDKRINRFIKNHQHLTTALARNAKQQEKVNKKLTDAKKKLADAKRAAKEYAAQVKQALVAHGNVVGLGKTEDDTVTTGGLLDDLRQRAIEVKRYAALIKQLTKAGLNKTTIQQLLDAGVEGGLATAEAIVAGGSKAIKEVNYLTSQIAKEGTSLGSQMSKTFHQAGIDAAAGLVKGLEKQAKALDKVATKLANTLVKTVKTKLGIKSPSRVFRDLGTETVKGLTIGLGDVDVKRPAARLAADLQQGFGKPALEAYTHDRSVSGNEQRVKVTLTAEQVSALQRGREVAMDLDTYYKAGGRRAAV